MQYSNDRPNQTKNNQLKKKKLIDQLVHLLLIAATTFCFCSTCSGFALAAVPFLCTSSRRSHALLLPSATATISCATRFAKTGSRRLSAEARIHLIAARRREFGPSGHGTGSMRPPPATPRAFRTPINGSRDETTRLRYWTGLSGSWAGGGPPGRRRRLGLGVGGGEVRR
jgi:hypothetical protein